MTNTPVIIIEKDTEIIYPLINLLDSEKIPYIIANLKNSLFGYESNFIICNIKLTSFLKKMLFEQNSFAKYQHYIVLYGSSKEKPLLVNQMNHFSDDFFLLPLELDNILAKINAFFRRQNQIERIYSLKTHYISYDHMSIDPLKLKVVLYEKNVNLTHSEFQIVYTLAFKPNVIYSMDFLYELINDQKCCGDYNALMTHISRIRKKFAEIDPFHPYIITVRNEGYLFNPKYQ